jgi:hypothetical protein
MRFNAFMIIGRPLSRRFINHLAGARDHRVPRPVWEQRPGFVKHP